MQIITLAGIAYLILRARYTASHDDCISEPKLLKLQVC